MKLVDFETFNRMPAGTIFAPYTPCVLEERLAIKVDHGREATIPLASLFPSYEGWHFNGVMPLEPWNIDFPYWDGDSVKATFEIYDGDTNDYRDYKQFLIFEECDIDRLIQVLLWAKGGCKDGDYKGFDEW